MPRNVGEWKTDLDVAIKNRHFSPSEPIAILPFLQTFQMECDVLSILEDAAIWLLTPFLRDPAMATFQSRMGREGAKAPGSLKTYLKVVTKLLGTYAADEILS